jgi:copper homeostasis protein
LTHNFATFHEIIYGKPTRRKRAARFFCAYLNPATFAPSFFSTNTFMELEICAANLQSAIAAQSAGASRIELCSGLESGGLTPSAGLIQLARKSLTIPVHVLIRPREGHFCYTTPEIDMMCEDIRVCRALGVAGVVIGALESSGKLDLHALGTMQAAAEGLDVTCHRAFDFTPDPFEALDQLMAMGFKRVLSSGQAATAYEGRHLLQKMVEYAQGRIRVMPGAGITVDNIAEMIRTTRATDYHMTAKSKVTDTLGTRIIPGLDAEYWESDVQKIRTALGHFQ